MERIQELDEVRSAKGRSVQRVEEWIQGEGRPGGIDIADHEGPQWKLQKGKTLAMARRRIKLAASKLRGIDDCNTQNHFRINRLFRASQCRRENLWWCKLIGQPKITGSFYAVNQSIAKVKCYAFTAA